MMLFTAKLDSECPPILFHIGLSLDHKFFAPKKQWALGFMVHFSVFREGKEPLQASFLVGLLDCTNPRYGDKGPETTAKYLVGKMKELCLWEFRDQPEINIAVDGALSNSMVPYLEQMGWDNVIYCIVLCEGHTVANIFKIIYNHVVHNVLKNQHWEGKFFFQYV